MNDVNESFARQFFPDGEPIGRRIASPDFGPQPCEIVGAVSCVVAERTQEIGIRLALGAQRSRLVTSVIGRGVKPVLLGAATGLAGAWGLTRSLRGLLFEISPTDPLTFVLVLVFLGGTAVLACYLPARRAAGIDPMEALRNE